MFFSFVEQTYYVTVHVFQQMQVIQVDERSHMMSFCHSDDRKAMKDRHISYPANGRRSLDLFQLVSVTCHFVVSYL